MAHSAEDLAPQAPDQPWQVSREKEAPLTMPPAFTLPADVEAAPLTEPDTIDLHHTYTLPELIDLAQKNNPETRIAWEQSKQAAHAVGIASSTYLPEISAEILGGRQHTPLPIPKSLVSRGYFEADTNEVLPSLVIKWLLFDFGRREGAVEAAKQLSLTANIAFTGAHQKLIFDVSKAYFMLDAYHAQLRVAQEALKSAKTLQNAAEEKAKQGLATTLETALARRATAQAKFDLERTRAADNNAYYALMDILGLKPTLKIKVESIKARDLPATTVEDVDTYIQRALAQRPDVAAAYAKLRASEAAIKSAKAAYYPTLGVEGSVSQNIGSVSIDGGPNYNVNEPAAGVLFRLKMPLYDGGKRHNELGIARSRNAEAQEELQKAQDTATRQVAQAFDAFKSALAEYSAARELVKASNLANEAALEAYQHGVGTFTDSMTSQTQKAKAASVQAHAYATVLTTAAAMAFTTGDLTSVEALRKP